MLIKKFSCTHCGAPKVNSYTNPYVVCDYCGFMIDVDYLAGLQVWKHSQEHTEKYIEMKAKFETNSAKYLKQKNEQEYWKEHYNYWDFYYTHFPEYLPPTVAPGEKYRLFIKAAADMALEAMHKTKSPLTEKYNLAYQNLEYYQENNKNYVKYPSFLKMISAYLELLQESFETIYNNPEYNIMHNVLPEKFHVKMKLSQITQVWLPYLKEKEAEYFLESYGLKYEYTEAKEPHRYELFCESCGKENHVPVGALVCICEHCRQHQVLKKFVTCLGCGCENELPDNWNHHITCKACNTKLRVVQPLFG
ncbi:MAG: hypothetical protein P1P88_04675 [Bacteroidales bacterium]|nr:hypothetical protein [Bacteroidales bacterium]